MFGESQLQKAIAVAVTILLMVGSLAVLLPFAALPVAGDAPFSVNIKVNTELIPADQNEVDLAVDAVGRLYSVWEDNRNTDLDIFFANSTDSGATWTDPNKQINTGGVGTVQAAPAIAAYGTGNLYVAWEDMQGGDFDIYFANSTDSGITWSPSMIVNTDGSGFAQSAPDLAADSSGTVYAVWQDFRSATDFDIFFAKSMDGGFTWTHPNVRVNTDATTTMQRNPTIAVDSLNNIYVAWQDEVSGNYDINVSKSIDGGMTWSNPAITVNTDGTIEDQTNPDITVDPLNNIYITWQDKRIGDWDIYFANSTDGGLTWTHPNVIINSDGTVTNQQNPSIAVGTSGIVHIAWDDLRLIDKDIYFANSTDGGVIWTFPNLRVNDDPAGKTQANPALAAFSSDKVYVAWEDFRNNEYDIYFASLQPPPLPPTVDFIILTDIPDGSPLTTVNLIFGQNITVYASGYNNTGPSYVGLVEVDWTQTPTRGNFNSTTGPSIIFTADVAVGIVDINGTGTSNPTWADNFTVNITSPTVDYIEITDIPDGTPLSGGSVLAPFIEWGNCSMYNYTVGYLPPVAANWTVVGGNASLLAATPSVMNGINVGNITGSVWLNASYDVHMDSVMYNVTTWTVDSINITYVPDGNPLMGGPVPVGFMEWGNCSAYNITAGYIGTVPADWTVDGVGASRLGPTPNILNGVNVGTVSNTVWFNASYNGHNDSVQYTVIPPTVDYIIIVDNQDTGAAEIPNQTVGVGFTITGYAAAFNFTSDYIADIMVTWSVVNGSGAAASTAPLTADNSTFNSGVTGGNAEWKADDGSGHTDNVTFTITTSTVDSIKIVNTYGIGGAEIADQTVGAGFIIQAWAAAFNATIGYIYDITVNWTLENASGAAAFIDLLSGMNTTFNSGANEGEATLTADDGAGHNDTVVFTIDIVYTIDNITIVDTQNTGINEIADQTVDVGFIITGYAAAFNTSKAGTGYLYDVTVDWSVDTVGTTLPASGVTSTFDAGLVGGDTATWTADYMSEAHIDTVVFTVRAPTVDYIQIEDSAGGAGNVIDTVIYPVDDFDIYYCVAYNKTAGYIGEVSASWEVNGGIGEVFPTTGTFTQFNATTSGTGNVTATYNNLSVATGVITVVEPTVDYIQITDIPGGASLAGGSVPVGFSEWGYCSVYNDTVDYLNTQNAAWTVEGGDSSLLGSSTPDETNGIDVGLTPGTVWLNVTYNGLTYSVEYTVSPPEVDYINITDVPDGTPLSGGSVPVGFSEWGNCSLYNNTVGYIGTGDAFWTATGGNSELLGGVPLTMNGIDVGTEAGTVTFTARYNLDISDSVIYTVLDPEVDYIIIRDAAGGSGIVLDTATFTVGDSETFYAAGYNDTSGFVEDIADAVWVVTGGIGSATSPGAATTFNATAAGVGKITVTHDGISNESGDITVAALVTISQPGQPQIESKGEDFIEITWPANSETNIGGYRIYRRLSPNDDWALIDSVEADITSYKDQGLESGTTYYYSITAVDDEVPPHESTRSASFNTKTDEPADDEFPWMILIIIIIIVIVVVMLLILGKRKPKEEGIPEEKSEAEDTAVEETEAPLEEEGEYGTGEEPEVTEDAESFPEEEGPEPIEDMGPEEEPDEGRDEL